MTEHPRTRELEGFAAGEPATEVARHIEDCGRCRGQVAQLAHERERLLARVPAPAFVAQVATRRQASTRRVRRRLVAWCSGLGGVGIAAAASWTLMVREVPLSAAGTIDGARLKGVGVELYRRRGERVEPLTSDGRVRAGDGLRISVTLPAAGPVSAWFVDAQGRVDRFSEALPLHAGENVLPGAVVVDDPCVDLRVVVSTSAGELARTLHCE